MRLETILALQPSKFDFKKVDADVVDTNTTIVLKKNKFGTYVQKKDQKGGAETTIMVIL